jgi:murein DD-endopeptidase MepM/ murein hydrolase activator NlpD
MEKRNRWLYLILGGFILICLFLPVASATEPEIALSATSVRPGDFFRIKVQAAPESVVRVIFQGVSKTLPANAEGVHLGLLAATYYKGPDTYPLGVEITGKDQNVITALYQIEVTERKFPESRVVMEEKKRKTILTTSNQDSDAKKTEEARKKALREVKTPLWKGPFIWPFKGTITTEFGFIRYINNIENGRHSGIDIAAPEGTPVLAVNDGQVVFAGNLHLTGLTIIIYHGLDLYSSYGHLSAIKIQDGAQVAKGELIGLVGSTGLSTGPHTHFTFRIGEISVDPNLFLGREVGWDF